MVHTSLDGLDVLYHHAKFGEDRTTRAGCSLYSENVLFVYVFFVCFFFTGRCREAATYR